MRIIKRILIFFGNIFIYLFPYKKVKYKIKNHLLFLNLNKEKVLVILSEENLVDQTYIGNFQINKCKNLLNLHNFVYEDASNKIAFEECDHIENCLGLFIKKFIIKDDVLIIYIKKFDRNYIPYQFNKEGGCLLKIKEDKK
jgi:hypothetical protein